MSSPQLPPSDRIAAVLACLRREMTYDAAARQFNVSADDIRRWEADFIAGGTSALNGGELHVADLKDQISEARDLATEMGALNAISQSLTSILDLDELLDTTATTLHWVFGYMVSIALVDGTDLIIKVSYALNGEKLPVGNTRVPIDAARSVTAWVAANGRPLNVPDTTIDSRYTYRAAIGDVKSELAMPIIFKGTVLGVLTARSAKSRAFGQRDTSLLETIACHLAIAIENAQLFQAVRRRVAQLELVQSITARAIEDLDVQAILDFTVRTTCIILDYSTASVGLITEDRTHLAITTISSPLSDLAQVQVHQVRIDGTTLMGLAVAQDRLILSNDVRSDDRLSKLLPDTSQSALAVPIRSLDTLIGVISVESDRPGAFDDTDLATITILADQLTSAIRGARLFQQTQAQLREISLFRRLADEAIVGIMTRDTDGLVDYCNPAAAALFGYPNVAAMHGISVRSLYGSDEWYTIDQQVCQRAMYQGGWSGEVTQQRRDGQTIVTDMSIFPIRAPDGAFMTYGTVLQDATERHRLLDVIQRANARFEAILDATDDGVIVWDEFWRVLLVNPAACRLLGELPDKLIGSTHADWEAQPLLEIVANAQEGQQIEFPGDKPRVGRCRNLRWHSDRASGHLTLISDVTSQVEFEKWREEMTFMLIHDLVSPLNSLVGCIEVAQEMLTEGEDQTRVLEFMSMASRNGWVLLSMINSLLDIHRLESGRARLEYTPLQVNALFEEVIGILSTSAQAANISVTTSCQDDLPVLLADHGMIRRSLTNLLDNALKFTPDGGRVVLMAEREGDNMIRFSVADTGPGVPEAYRKKLFQRYSRVPGQEGRRRGTGLGLVFCRLVAEAHHGRIWVESGSEGGSVFHFTIMGGDQTDQTSVPS